MFFLGVGMAGSAVMPKFGFNADARAVIAAKLPWAVAKSSLAIDFLVVAAAVWDFVALLG